MNLYVCEYMSVCISPYNVCKQTCIYMYTHTDSTCILTHVYACIYVYTYVGRQTWIYVCK